MSRPRAGTIVTGSFYKLTPVEGGSDPVYVPTDDVENMEFEIIDIASSGVIDTLANAYAIRTGANGSRKKFAIKSHKYNLNGGQTTYYIDRVNGKDMLKSLSEITDPNTGTVELTATKYVPLNNNNAPTTGGRRRTRRAKAVRRKSRRSAQRRKTQRRKTQRRKTQRRK